MAITPALVAGLAGYLVGAVPVGYLTVRLAKGVDIRDYGTGNPGTANVYRNIGLGWALLVAAGTVLQGFGPPLIVRLAGQPQAAVVASGVGAAVGYGWPVFTRFRGGKAVAVASGAVAGVYGLVLAELLIFYLAGLAMRRIALGVVVGFALLPIVVALLGASAADRWGAVVLLVVLLLRRLDGISQDPPQGALARRVLDRLVFDQAPGQSLVGQRRQKDASG